MNLDPHWKPILVVSGLAAEAGIAAGAGVVCLAAPPAALSARLAELEFEPSAVVSFGLCGGLDPSLRAGAIVVGTRVVHRDESWACDADLASGLTVAGSLLATGTVACADAPVLTTGEKAMLQAKTGAIAVDTESHLAAAYAAERGLPFAVLRAVCDTADSDLPPLAVRAIGPDGKLDANAIARELTFRPAQLLALPGTALATLRALRSLRRVRRGLGPRFGL